MRNLLFTKNLNIITSSKATPTSCRVGSSGQSNLGTSIVQVGDQNQIPHPMLPYSSQSRQSVMISNLKLGIEYKSKQYDNLSSINDYLNEIISISNPRRDSNSSTWLIYLQSIASVSGERHLNFPLFGHGVEPPVRVHLVLDGRPQIFEFHVSELLNRTHFKSLMYSGAGTGPPLNELLHDCLSEVMDELLKVSTERSNAELTLDKLEILSINKAKLLMSRPRKTHRNHTIFEKLFQLLSSQIFQKLRSA
ncbi:MAG: hypothetical protein HN548_00855 [Opitutae bacterium]|nr:hypothetical protein [Opitutae bacterium]